MQSHECTHSAVADTQTPRILRRHRRQHAAHLLFPRIVTAFDRIEVMFAIAFTR